MEADDSSIVKSNCVFGLCVKNNSVGLPKVFENINQIRKLFHIIHIVAYYDNSGDDSLLKLHDLSKHYTFSITILNESAENSVNQYRTISIANARNNILKWIMGQEGEKYELFVMMDSNDYSCQGSIKPQVLRKYFNSEIFQVWDGLSFARKPYYDLWAFSNGQFQLGCWSYPTLGQPVIVSNYQKALQEYIKSLIDHGRENKMIIPVDSAFCGFAIYKKDKYRRCFYSGLTQLQFFDKEKLMINLKHFPVQAPGKLDCEHRSFHFRAKMINKAQLYMACEELFEPRPEDFK